MSCPKLAFNHNEIISTHSTAYRTRSVLAYRALLPGRGIHLAQLRERCTRRFWAAPWIRQTLRRQIAASKSIIDTGRRVEGTRHRPPRLYRYNDAQAYADAGPLGMYRERHEA